MNKYLLFLSFFLVAGFSYSQDKSCYQQYTEIFKIRGARTVVDSVHDNVIFTIRTKDGGADCFLGKVVVKNKAISEMYLMFEDGTYEPFILKRETEFPITVQNGISRTVVTTDEEIFNVMFVNHIKPPKKKYKRAPAPKIGSFK